MYIKFFPHELNFCKGPHLKSVKNKFNYMQMSISQSPFRKKKCEKPFWGETW